MNPTESSRRSYQRAAWFYQKPGRALVVTLFFVLGHSVIASGQPSAPVGETHTERQESGYQKQWFIYAGATNYHTRLEPSEKQIDEEINGLFGTILPRWREPETFKDWSDDWKLWDIWIGVGRDISPKWTWAFSVGAGEGTVKNSRTYYPLLIPSKVKVDFTRLEAYLEGTLSWYPWGKPTFANQTTEEGQSKFGQMLRGTRPFLDFAGGYDYQVSEADVRIKMPLVGTVFREHQKDDYHLLYFNPRVGIETPISEKNSIGTMAGYVFFHEHGDEFNSALVNVFFRHRF